MGDHFVLLMDQLLTESTLEAAIERNNKLQQAMSSASKENMADFSSDMMVEQIGSFPGKLVQCRICHDEDEDSNLEIPCSCCGSLKVSWICLFFLFGTSVSDLKFINVLFLT